MSVIKGERKMVEILCGETSPFLDRTISKGFVAWDQVDFGQAAPPRRTDQLLRRCQHITGVPVLEFS